MKTNEHFRMEAFYNAHFPAECLSVLSWEVDDDCNYLIGFARLAWAAWQAAKQEHINEFVNFDPTMQNVLETEASSGRIDLP